MIDDSLQIDAPGGFAPVVAIGTDDGSGALALIGPEMPVPTTVRFAPGPAALEGETAQLVTAGPFTPAALAPIYLTLSGSWQGQVTLLRSTDGGVTRHSLTVGGAAWGSYSTNVCEAAWIETEPAAQLWLELRPTSGTIAYRVAQ